MPAARAGVERLLPNPTVRTLAGVAFYWSIPVFYAWSLGENVAWYSTAYGAYLLAPALLLLVVRSSQREPHLAAVACAAVMLWLPIEFHLLPPLQLTWPIRVEASLLLAVVAAFYLFLIGRPLDGVGYTFALRRRDLALALGALVIYALVALPIGVVSGFLRWNPRVSEQAVLLTPIVIFLVTALPEEFLFRGLLQNVLQRWFGTWGALALAAVIFGFAHLPDYRYVVLATLAGVAYGMVYVLTKKITASAITHAGVDLIWVLLLRASLVIIVVGLSAATVLGQDWPQFRGPTGQGHADARDVPVEWSETKNVAWKTPVAGLGWSSPVVGGGRVWLTTATGDRDVSLRALAYDVESGKEVVDVEVFRVRSPRDINPKNSWASPTPILDGERVYVHFGADGTAALTTSGEIVWKANFPYASQHGAGGSPVVYGDLLIFSGDGSDTAFVVALDKRTGKVRWKVNRRYPHDQAYTTPLVIRVGDRDQVVSIGAFRVGAYDPATGKEIWRAGYADGFSNVPRPVFGHGLVYVATGFQQPSLIAIRPDGTGDVTKTHIAWELRRGAPLTPSPILIGDELYVVNDGGILSCVDAKSGSVLWQQRLGGSYSASPLFVDGRIYFSAEQGLTTVLVPGKAFRRISTNTLDGAILASIAVAQGSLFIRTDSNLYRISQPSVSLVNR